MKLYKKIKYNGVLECISGLHIGDSKDNVEIGGLDGPVIRAALRQNQPYVPGSSLKGKIRCLLQQVYGELGFENGPNAKIARLFGAQDGEKVNGKIQYPAHASRLIVRDSYLSKDSVKALENSPFTDMPFTEQKYENSIDRVTGTVAGSGVRSQERVPAGAKFNIEFVINVFGKTPQEAQDNETEFMKLLDEGIDLLNSDYLGGGGSRGSGHVRIELNKDKIEEKVFSTYETIENAITDEAD